MGSPGVGVATAAELGIDPHHVWATRADNDIIRRVPDGWFGNDPTDPDFGGQTFHSNPGETEMRAHSGYWKDEEALDGMAEIITGTHEDGMHAPGLEPPPPGPVPAPAPAPAPAPRR